LLYFYSFVPGYASLPQYWISAPDLILYFYNIVCLVSQICHRVTFLQRPERMLRNQAPQQGVERHINLSLHRGNIIILVLFVKLTLAISPRVSDGVIVIVVELAAVAVVDILRAVVIGIVEYLAILASFAVHNNLNLSPYLLILRCTTTNALAMRWYLCHDGQVTTPSLT